MATHSSLLAWSVLQASEFPSNQTEALLAWRCKSHQTGDQWARSGFEDAPCQHTTWEGGSPHAPTHHCPTPRMSGEDPHPPRDVQSSAGPHEVGWKERQQVELKKKQKTPNVSAASPLPVDPEDMLGLRWERYAGLRGRVLWIAGGWGTSWRGSTPETCTWKPAGGDGVR